MALAKKRIGEVRPDESSTTGYHDSHGRMMTERSGNDRDRASGFSRPDVACSQWRTLESDLLVTTPAEAEPLSLSVAP